MTFAVSGVATPAGYLSELLSGISAGAVTGEEAEIASLLEDAKVMVGEFGQSDLAGRMESLSQALREGKITRSNFAASPLLRDLASIQERLAGGVSLEEAFGKEERPDETLARLEQAVPAKIARSITARPARIQIGPPPVIRWEEFGGPKHPAPNPPSDKIANAGKRLSYFVFYVAGIAGFSDSLAQTASFYGIPEDLLRKIREGHFAPKALGQFPSETASKFIRAATRVEPNYGKLMHELLIHAIFESQGWSLGQPHSEAPWDLSFVYALRRHLAGKLLTEKGRKEILEDSALIAVAKGKASLEEVRWHPGKTRREVFEKWLAAITGDNEAALARLRRYIGDGILKTLRWSAPPAGASEAVKLQWRFRLWISHCHYGALPARGLPVSTGTLLRFAHAKMPTDLDPEFRRNFLEILRA